MPYRKFLGDQLFTGEVTLGSDKVLITDEQGKIESIVDVAEAGENVLKCNGIISPAFINCHCHLELSHLLGRIVPGVTLTEFASLVMDQRNMGIDELPSRIKQEMDKMWQTGIVGVGDICNTDLSLQAKEASKIGFHNFIEVSGWDPGVAHSRFQAALSVYNKFRKAGQRASITPHAPYSVSSPLWEKMSPLFGKNIVSIHSQESREEDKLFKSGNGKFLDLYAKLNISNSDFVPAGTSSLKYFFPKISHASSVILVHNTFANEADIEYLIDNRKSGTRLSLCVCPRANKFIENAIPPIEMFCKKGMHIVIGTDSLASNLSLNILDEFKYIAKYFPTIQTPQILRWATLNGAVALEWDDKLGSFEPGKIPGVINITKIRDSKITDASEVVRLV